MNISKYRLPLAWTIAELLGISLQTFHSIACEQPAKIFGLRHKGKLEKGYDADMVVWSPERTQSCPTNVCEKFEPLCQKMNYSLKGVVSNHVCSLFLLLFWVLFSGIRNVCWW